jgi:hypothetical protein
VIEKIVNRGRKTRLSAELEGQMRNADEIALAHQMQCVLVELLKQQSAKMLQDIDENLPIRSDMRMIEQTVDEMINTFRERDNVMKNLVEEE